MDKEYKFDAFISYRHTDLDKFVAENLHRVLETYELPKNIKEKLNIKGRTIKRVFRDQDELPLSSNLEDPIVDALKNSKYLIVICSPRLKESLWCRKEIETFKKIRGRKNIFCVLIEGEPEDSFPDEVRFEEVTIVDKNGKKKKQKEYFEPLAADIRGFNKKEVLRKIKSEKLRLIAPMYNLDYDDLKQRHRQRRIKRIITTSVTASSVFFLIALYSVLMLLKISHQQKMLKLHQAEALVTKATDYLNKDSKFNAVKSSYEALTKFNGVKMPYTSDGEYSLAESLGVYDAGITYRAVNELQTKGVVDYIKESADNNFALTIDESDEITLWDIQNVKKIKSYNDINSFGFSENKFTFIGSDKFAYISNKGNVNIGSTKTGKIIHEIEKTKNSYVSISSDVNGKYIAINDSPDLYLYNAEDYKLIGKYSVDKALNINDKMQFTLDSKNLVVFSSKSNYDILNSVKSVVHIFTTADFTEKDHFEVDAEYFENIIVKDNMINILGNKTVSMNNSAVLVSYNNKVNKVNYIKEYADSWGKILTRSSYEGANNLAIVHGNLIHIINPSNGEMTRTFSVSSDVIGIFSSTSADVYVVFTSDATVNFLNLKAKENFKYPGLFELNLNNYTDVIFNGSGYYFLPKYENRVIYYTQNTNKKIKEENLNLDYVKDESINLSDYDKVKEEYNIKKKNLVKKIIYADNKKLLIISYSDKTASIYDVKTKKFMNMIDNVDVLEHYFGKDKNDRIYLGNTSNSYILDKDYNKVAYIKGLAKLDKKNNRVIISKSGKYYSLPIYSYEDLIKEAKEYLNK